MVGDERVRHCSRCARDVFDLSAMTAYETESLLRAHDALPDGGLPCVRFYRRADGTILTADCIAGTGKKRALQAALAAVTLTTATATAAALKPPEATTHRTHFEAPQVRVDLPPTAEQLAIAAQLDADFDRLTACMGSCYTLEDARTFQEGLRGGGRSEVTLEDVMGRVGAEADEEAE